jgi:hypothetical protein
MFNMNGKHKSEIGSRYANQQDRFQLIGDFSEGHYLRSSSIFMQAQVILHLREVNTVLEIGSLRGVLTSILRHFKLQVDTCDIESIPFLSLPTFLEDFEHLQVSENSYDLVCAFQVLEHNNIKKTPLLLRKMANASKKYVYVSLPFEGIYFYPKIISNFRGTGMISRFIKKYLSFIVQKPLFLSKRYSACGGPTYYHQYELGGRNFRLSKLSKIFDEAGLKILWAKPNTLFPYHYHILSEKTGPT